MASAAFLVDGTVTRETPADDRAPGSPGLLRTVASFANAAARTGKGRDEQEEGCPPPSSLRKRFSIFRASTLTTAEAISGVSEGIGALSRSKRMRIGFGAAAAEEVEEVEVVGIYDDDDETDRIRVCCSCRLLDSAARDALALALEAERSTCAGNIAIARVLRGAEPGDGEVFFSAVSFFSLESA